MLKPEYNILKKAWSLLRFKHNNITLSKMPISKLGCNRSEKDKLAISKSNKQAQFVLVINNKTGEKKIFLSIRKAATFIGLHYSYIAKSININNKYKGKDCYVKKTDLLILYY